MKSGIYKILNYQNGHFYTGSAKNLVTREAQHFNDLKIGKHCNIILTRAYEKYGVESLFFEIIEYCKEGSLIEREQYYMDTLKPHYNISPTAGNSLGRKHTPEAIEKIRFASNLRKNLQVTLDALEKGRMWAVDKTFTEEHRRKLSLSKNPNGVRGVNVITEEVIEFSTRYDAKLAGYRIDKVGECCKGTRKTHKGYYWSEIIN